MSTTSFEVRDGFAKVPADELFLVVAMPAGTVIMANSQESIAEDCASWCSSPLEDYDILHCTKFEVMSAADWAKLGDPADEAAGLEQALAPDAPVADVS